MKSNLFSVKNPSQIRPLQYPLIIGILVNGITLYVIYSRKSVQNQSITPMITYFTVSNLLFCTFGVPIQAARYHAREWPLPVGM